MADPKKNDTKLNVREKVAVRLVLFIIQIIHPFEYSHEFTKFFDEMKQAINEQNI